MTAAQIQARVDAWLAAHVDWLSASASRTVLAAQWYPVTRSFGAGSSAALGVLLGLVREAWGDHSLSAARMCRGAGTHESTWLPDGAERTESGGWMLMRWGVTSGGVGKCKWCDSEAEALLAALEAAP